MDRASLHPEWSRFSAARRVDGQPRVFVSPPVRAAAATSGLQGGGGAPHFRQFSRYDYSHSSSPRIIPFVRDYEHGVNEFAGIPVFNPLVPPPPIIANSAASNHSLFNAIAPEDPGLSKTSFDNMRRGFYDSVPPPPTQDSVHTHPPQGLGPSGGLPYAQLLSMYENMQAQYAALTGEIRSLKGGDVRMDRGVSGGAADIHEREIMEDDLTAQGQDVELNPSGTGDYCTIIFDHTFVTY